MRVSSISPGFVPRLAGIFRSLREQLGQNYYVERTIEHAYHLVEVSSREFEPTAALGRP